MWRPPAARRVALPQEQPPTPDQASVARWFSPLRVGPVQLQCRTWVPAMVPWRASDQGMVSEASLDWYGRFAQGKPGALVVEATGIRDIPSGPLLRIGDDRFLPGLKRLVARVREASEGQTRLFIQLIDFLPIRRRPAKEVYFQRYFQPKEHHRRALGAEQLDDNALRATLLSLDEDALAELLDARELEALKRGYRERVTDLHLDPVRDLPETLPGLFSDAARRAAEAGFDGVELHYAHAYTMASFLSAHNTRDDGYGGGRALRARLPLEVLGEVRAAVADSIAVGLRMLSEECIDGGSTLEDACFFAGAFAAQGSDFISLSRGGKFEDAAQPRVGSAAYPYTGPSGWECMPTVHADARGPFGRNVQSASTIRAALRARGLRTPVVLTGGISTFAQAEAILRAEQADLVGAARQSLADPDWFEKIRLGRADTVRRCEYTNYCEGLDQKHKPVTCKLWDRTELEEAGAATTDDGRRRLVAPPWKKDSEHVDP